MGIYIYGKMPTNGEVIVIKPNGQAILYASDYVAFIDDPRRTYKTIYKTIEPHPHGRLVDADEVAKSVRKQTDIVRSWNIDDMTQIADLMEKGFLQELENADTVVEGDST